MTVLEIDGNVTDKLHASQPTLRFQEEMGPLIPMNGSEDSTGAPRIFWSLKLQQRRSPERSSVLKSAFLVDGIKTETKSLDGSSKFLEVDHAPLGTTINLNEDLRPDLSVDRFQIFSSALVSSFVRTCIDNGGWRSLEYWKAPELETLQALFESYPIAMANLSDALTEHQIHWPLIALTNIQSKLYYPSILGICDLDAFLFETSLKSEGWRPLKFTRINEILGKWLSLRVADLIDAGLSGTTTITQLAAFARHSTPLKYHPLLGNIFGFFSIYERDSKFPRFKSQARLTLYQMLAFISRQRIPVSTAKDLAHRLANLGISVPNLECLASEADIKLSRQQLTLMAKSLNKEFQDIGKLTPFHVMGAACLWNLSIEEVIETAKPLTKGLGQFRRQIAVMAL
jgi:hypothetical protein